MLAVGNGSQQSIQASVTSLGSNLLTITSSAQRTGLVAGSFGSGQSITMSDAQAIRDDNTLTDVGAVSAEYSQNQQIIGPNSANSNSPVNGVQLDYATVHNYQIDQGSWITDDQISNRDKVAVLGPDTATTLFGSAASAIGQTIRINKITFNVIGTTVSKGTSGITNADDNVFIPLSTGQSLLFGENKIRTIVVQGKDSATLSILQNQIDNLLRQRHKLDSTATADFTIRNSADTLSTLDSITGIFTLLLASISGISLLVGGIGIMNIMIVSVTERTKEIGLRKAIGAPSSSILGQFLVEAMILTFSGGVLGVLCGYLISYVLSSFIGIKAQVGVDSIVLSVSVSIIIGVIFGMYPAYRASKLNPIEALRYE
jgi:putative ABC transport system permease protein